MAAEQTLTVTVKVNVELDDMEQVGVWHPDYGFMEKDRYDMIIEFQPDWDDVGFRPVYVVGAFD